VTLPVPPNAPPADAGGAFASTSPASTPKRKRAKRRFSLLTRRDKLTLGLMVGIPAFIHIFLIWLPTVGSVILSFTDWNGIGGLDRIRFVGLKNYETLANIYQPFWPAVQHNLMWLGAFLFIATPLGMLIAVILDQNIRGTRIYQSALYMPVVLSLAIVGFIWQLMYAPGQGFINNMLATVTGNSAYITPGTAIDWIGTKGLNLAAILVAAGWRHVGYIMVLYLAGLKSVDPTLREAASIDGANARQTFFRVIFPVLAPINVVVLVVTVIESLRAFDIVYVTNKGLNGLELLSVLIVNNLLGEASLIGFGSAIAVVLLVISIGPIIFYLYRTMREEPA
jgi:multiple sugar transport system permease protein